MMSRRRGQPGRPVRVMSAPVGLVQRCGGVKCPPGTCDHDETTAAPYRRAYGFSGNAIQPKLAIGPKRDSDEQEADRMADTVMRMPAPLTVGDGDPCERAGRLRHEPAHGADEPVTASEGKGPRTAAPSTQRLVQETVRRPGEPMDPATRTFMEPRFGHDFSQIRIHTDAQAAQSAKAVDALAYTLGTNVVFGAGQYAPDTPKGRRVLAHELTHTIQQTSGLASVAAQPTVQRTLGDSHDLTSPRFAGDLVLEGVYDNERVLKVGDRGPAVRKLQQALIDSGMSLPTFGVDGDFGPETKAAVSAFQHASGLTGTDVDGVVGPTTMGWLDQNFSAGPTPAGTSPGATTGCPSIKSVSVDLVSLDGSSRNPNTDLERANTILNQCCVHLSPGLGASQGSARTRALLGGDTDLAQSPSCGSTTAEETALMSGATADLGLSSRIRAFFVATINSGAPSYSVPPFCATGPAAPLQDMAVVANSASVRGLAHEIGHILLNSGSHPAIPANLMSPVAAPPGEQLTSAQCATIFANA